MPGYKDAATGLTPWFEVIEVSQDRLLSVKICPVPNVLGS